MESPYVEIRFGETYSFAFRDVPKVQRKIL